MSAAQLVESYGGVVISIVVLVAVELAARQGSPRMAAVAASLPTGLPLALFIMSSKAWAAAGSSQTSVQATLINFSDAVLRGTLGTFAFAVAMSLAARRGLGVASMLACAYAAWLAVFAGLGVVQRFFSAAESKGD
eukprot:TRINITY_DN38214_c0_g1_i1.p1 TRINITY_DN38214_c0_g1~~TRINITY_DN38214_c0_g1_i1.p1  ORF type:complete len:147 (-),score=31.11 TRINITY_DN38214_c0_g1_i1:106-513(-)